MVLVFTGSRWDFELFEVHWALEAKTKDDFCREKNA
jgi:hypothetical protein